MELIYSPDTFGVAFNIINQNTKESFVNVSYSNGNLIVTRFNNTTITVPLPIAEGNQILSLIGSITLGSTAGLYNQATITPFSYLYNNQKFSIGTTSVINLSNGDVSFDRIDAIYVNTTTNTVQKIEGVASANPLLPSIGSGNILLGAVYVKTGANPNLPYYELIYSAFRSQQTSMQINNYNNSGAEILDDLNDVEINSVADGDILTFDSLSNKWINKLPVSSTASLVDISYIRANPTTVTVGGYSAGSVPNFSTLQGLMDSILYPFVPPTVSIASNSLHEKGVTVSKTVSYSVNLNQGIVSTRTILLDNIVVNNPVSNNGNFTSTGLTYLNSPTPGALYPSHSFTYRVTFTNNVPLQSSILVEFVAPTFKGVLAFANIDQTNIKTLNKTIRKKANDSGSFSPTLQRYVYSYPSNFGTLTKIVDQNGFDVTASFITTTQNFTLADSTTENYRIYYSNADTTQSGFGLTFLF